MNQEISWWLLPEKEISSLLGCDLNKGLTQDDVLKRREEYGWNRLPKKRSFSILKLIWNQFSSVIVWLLIAAVIVAAILGEWVNATAISVIVFLNACLGFFQEYRAERSLEALQKLSRPSSKVIRNGKIQLIPSEELVPGDLLLLEAGDSIAADGRIIESTQLAIQEAVLTGESISIEKIVNPLSSKETPLGDKKNMGFMGTSVVRGKGKMVITDIGGATELGKIASLLHETEAEPTPLQIKLDRLGQRLTWICIAIVLIVFGAGLWRGSSFGDSLLIAISLAVAAIPEGLPAVVTITLSLGVRKMAARNALTRRLSSVETLGCTTVICTDKTGTLTQNEMNVRQMWINQSFVDFNQTSLPLQIEELIRALKIGVLCNNAEIDQEDVIGDPTEIALLMAAKKANLQKGSLNEEFRLKEELPFDSDRKVMSMLREKEGEYILFAKGAPDMILEISSKIEANGEIASLDENWRNLILQANETLANQALRVLGLAYRPLGSQLPAHDSLEKELIFVGLTAMMDPPRPEVKQAIELCHKAGINIVMITGDHKNTATAIARELDLLDEDKIVVSGTEWEKMDENALKKSVRKIAVYARASASLKLKIVKAWKGVGEIVAMTGDGANDAPAIKEADFGLAMGRSGTDVTREASDMVILDDNFATIVHAIEEGRGIYDNILKFVNYLISCNIAELLIIFASILFNFTDPLGNPFVALTAVQLLWLNLITDGLPAIALSMDPVDPRVMERPPRRPSEPILSYFLTAHLFTISCVIAIGTLIGCYWGLQHSAKLAYTMTFTILVALELVRVQMVRAYYHMSLFSNPLILISLGISLLLQMGVIYIPPLQKIFETVALGWNEWGIILAITLGVFVISTVVNAIFGKLGKRRMLSHELDR